VYWASNILAALVFGLGHLCATAARVLALNGIGGVVFG
jgi:hypothetical protein